MFPFWEVAIAPILDAVSAKRVVEIGALRGENTVQMLERLGPDTELHVIDPLPEFDPAEHERDFPGRYFFHRDLSLQVLPNIPAVDVALIDGDHNWYTVYNELRVLAETARNEGAPLPVMILHDVAWPYGRRDLYYAPEQIPKQHRQPFAQKGISMGRSKVLERGGLNPTMYNAINEGGPKNGVMTAADDFIAEYHKPLRLVFLPIYFGLAIMAEEDRVASEPELDRVLNRLEGAEGKSDLLELAESTRLDAMLFQHNVFYHREQWIDQLAHRYLKTLKDALLDEHRGEPRPYFPDMAMRRNRLDHLEVCLDLIREGQLPGDVVECGAGRGGGGVFARGYLEAWNQPWARVWVADDFGTGPQSTEADSSVAAEGDLGEVSWDEKVSDDFAGLDVVRDAYHRFDLLDGRVRFLVGRLDCTLPDAALDRIALLRIGELPCDSITPALETLYERVTIGGFIVVEAFDDPKCRESVEEFRDRWGIDDQLERIDAGAIGWRKTTARSAPTPAHSFAVDRASPNDSP